MRFRPLTLILLAALAMPARADYLDDIGYRSLMSRTIPPPPQAKGAGISVAQVEAPVGSGYWPDRSSPEFSGKQFMGHGSAVISPHATDVGKLIYGNQSGMAPRVMRISIFETDPFLDSKALRTFGHLPSRKLGVSVINNSWVAGYSVNDNNVRAIRRLDQMIARDNVVVVNAVDNSAPFPALLAPSYNGIAVGTLSGSSRGPVFLDSASGGRAKPDLVVPVDRTSDAAAIVSGGVALLLSEAKARQQTAINPPAIKAMLMAGAVRPDNWKRGLSAKADDKMVPVDYGAGAGQLRIDRSFDILSRFEKKPGQSHEIAWASSSIAASRKPQAYVMDFEDEFNDFTAYLVWNRTFKQTRGDALKMTSVLPDMHLLLERKDGKRWTNLAASNSRVDNIESITLEDLPAATYRLTVSSDRTTSYALAWYTDGFDGTAVPASFRGALAVDDGHRDSHGGSGASAVPEPSSVLLALPALCWLARRRRNH